MSAKSTCIYEIDYSTVAGERILPFVFSLNLDESVLYPEAGEYQKFCYDVIAVGQDESTYADLSHFLLGICEGITQTDIAEITVTVNGEPQTVIWGENVEIKTAEQPDHSTGCMGLKFDFPLDKVIGEMQVCMFLNSTYAVGPVNVCVYGGGTTATGLEICGPACGGDGACESVVYQKETVCVPVKVTPYAKAGEAKTTCCGTAVVTSGATCTGSQTSCTFTVTQSLCVEIPISFGADVTTGSALVQCGEASETPCDCSATDDAESEGEELLEEAEERARRFFGR